MQVTSISRARPRTNRSSQQYTIYKVWNYSHSLFSLKWQYGWNMKGWVSWPLWGTAYHSQPVAVVSRIDGWNACPDQSSFLRFVREAKIHLHLTISHRHSYKPLQPLGPGWLSFLSGQFLFSLEMSRHEKNSPFHPWNYSSLGTEMKCKVYYQRPSK